MTSRALRYIGMILFAICLAPSARAAEPAGDTAQKLFLWKVTGSQGVVYLFGTVHLGRADLYPLAPIIEASFKQADTLITEADLIEPQDTSRVLKLLLQKGVYPAGDTVETLYYAWVDQTFPGEGAGRLGQASDGMGTVRVAARREADHLSAVGI